MDSNIFIYAVDVAGSPEKSQTAKDVLLALARAQAGHISAQVKGEFASICTRKLKFSPAETMEMLVRMSDFRDVPYGSFAITNALVLMQRTSVSFWDAVMIGMAQSADCSVLLTEDMNHGQVMEGVRIHNPFIEMPKL